jgi:hypothetical protein
MLIGALADIHGNFDAMTRAMTRHPEARFWLCVGDVASNSGTYAPTWYETPAAQLPHTPKDDKRRHFVREEVEACQRLAPVDILMTHEAPRPFIVVPQTSGPA